MCKLAAKFPQNILVKTRAVVAAAEQPSPVGTVNLLLII